MNSERLMAKAQRALAAATRAAQAGDTETAADRVYYSVYYAASTAAVRHGQRPIVA